MKKIILGMMLAASIVMPAVARNFAVPTKNPVVTITVPDSWKTEEIEFGYSARSPDEAIFFSVEYASERKLDAMMANNDKWMKENKINSNVKPEKLTMNFNGASGEVIRYVTTDENGPTIVDFVLLSGGKNTVIMVTLWGDEQERKDNAADVDAIMNSIKPIN